MSEPLPPIELRFDRLDQHIERVEARLDQYHGETREVIATMLAALRENATAMVGLTRELGELRRQILDGRDQLRANTEATWRMLDRLDNGDGSAPAGA